jgi:hypothetical protein
LIPVLFGRSIVVDSFRLKGISPAQRGLAVTTTQNGHATGRVAQLFGVHPVCRCLQGRWRRFAAGAQFVLATIALSCTITLAAYLFFQRLPFAGTFIIGACFDIPTPIRPRVSCFEMIRTELLQMPEMFETELLWMPNYLVLGFASFAALRFLARRTARVSLEQLMEVDRRPPVLFLRSFLDDQVKLSRPRGAIWHRVLSIGAASATLDYVLLAEATPIGPVVAMGVPGSKPPFGAARVYMDDIGWQAEIARLADSARAIVIVIDNTAGVLWELAHIRQAGHEEKTLFLLPHRLTKPTEAEDIIQHATAEVFSTPHRPKLRCVGWHHCPDRGLSMFTTERPSRLSYTCAIRLALGGGPEIDR